MSRRRGASVLEFSLMLPFLVVLAAGVAEWGLYLRDRMLVVRAVREGARAGAVTSIEASPGPAEVAETRTREALNTYGLDGASATVTTSYANLNTTGDCDTDDTLNIIVSVPTETFISMVPMPDRVSAAMAMMIEDADCI